MGATRRPEVIIVGAGFAGLWAARILAQADAHVLLIDQNNYHTFLPLLYQAATAEVEPEDIVYPMRTVFRKYRSTEFLLAKADRTSVIEEVKEHYRDGHIIELDGLTVEYGDWWFNLRPSQTEPLLRLNVEAKTAQELEQRVSELQQMIEAHAGEQR